MQLGIILWSKVDTYFPVMSYDDLVYYLIFVQKKRFNVKMAKTLLVRTNINAYSARVVVDLLLGTGNTSTNTLVRSQRSNLLSQIGTSLAQPIKAGFISSSLQVAQPPLFF